jgi:hypothetical protein
MLQAIPRKLAAIALCLCTVIRSVQADDTYVAPVEDAFSAAQRQYGEGRFVEAFGNFYWAAIRDHGQAQEMVGLMQLLGPQVYGPGVRADREEARFWLAEAGKRGRDVTRNTSCALGQIGTRVLAAALVLDCLQQGAKTARAR